MANKKTRTRSAPRKRTAEIDITNEILKQDSNYLQSLVINPFRWTKKQSEIIDTALSKGTKIVFIKGPPGTAKTLISVYCSLVCLKERNMNKVVYIRVPIEACATKIGFLPAGQAEKMSPHLQPARDHLRELISIPMMERLIEEEVVEAIPLGFVKGLTLTNSAVIFDEAEDGNLAELCMVMNRLGKNSIMFIIGDEKQSNIKDSAFSKVFNAFSGEDSQNYGIHTFEFGSEDCMRSGITKFVVEKFDKIR